MPDNYIKVRFSDVWLLSEETEKENRRATRIAMSIGYTILSLLNAVLCFLLYALFAWIFIKQPDWQYIICFSILFSFLETILYGEVPINEGLFYSMFGNWNYEAATYSWLWRIPLIIITHLTVIYVL